MEKFELHSIYKPTGDQPQAIEKLTNGVLNNVKEQVLLGVTGSGKTFTMANIIKNVNKPTLVLAHNKTLAAQLCTEFREFFPNNAVEYFVSYYDYYQPEAYVPGKDIYIEKDAMINDEIDKLRHSATSALLERRDVIIVSSVSCIYSLGDPETYKSYMISLRPNMIMDRNELIKRFISIGYERNDIALERDKFRVHGDIIEIIPSRESDKIIRIDFFDDEIDNICEIDTKSRKKVRDLNYVSIFPATHYVIKDEYKEKAMEEIENELEERIKYFNNEGKLIEAQRIEERTKYDLEMIREIGYCSGVENYSRVLAGREPGSQPSTLLDFFPDDFLLFIDESHVTVPQVKGMSGGDRARKKNLIDYGFRLPSAFDNRPLTFSEFEKKINQVIYVSATPSNYELENSSQIAEQIVRPTGLCDPIIEVRKTEDQIDDLIGEINSRVELKERTLVTTITKKMAEDLTEYLEECGIKVKYIHHNVETIERMQLIRDLRLGVFDVLVGINLLREGLDIPEVSLVAILDADKEGFLRSESSLIQTFGRAARNVNGKVIMYADTVTDSMKNAINESTRRRNIQLEYNEKNGITPKSVIKDVKDIIEIGKSNNGGKHKEDNINRIDNIEETILELEKQMMKAAKELEFEQAARIRDEIIKIKNKNMNKK